MKKLLVSFVVVLSCACCVWAFPLSPERSSAAGTQVSEHQQVLEALAEKSRSTAEIINPVSTVLNDYATKSKITKADVSAVIDQLEAVNEDVEDIIREVYKTRFFFNGGVAVGFNAGMPTLGAVATTGLKVGRGLLITFGAEYDFLQVVKTVVDPIVGEYGVACDWTWSLDKLRGSFTIGWEF